MRKILFFICCFMGVVQLGAQPIFYHSFFPSFMDKQTAQLQAQFEKYTALQKPWQAALFLGEELRPTQETLQSLEMQIKQGYLHTASVLSFKSGNNEPAGTIHLYVLSGDEKKILHHTQTFPADTPQQVLLEALFSPLQNDSRFYTALLINGRGDGTFIEYPKHRLLSLPDLVRALKKYHLYIDVLDLQACRMGSAFAVNQLAQSSRVHYAIVSSELRRGSRKVMYYRLLNHFDKSPLQAALAAHHELPNAADFSVDTSTHNSIVIDISHLKKPFENWMRTLTAADAVPFGWTEFYRFLQTQNTPPARQLAHALQTAIQAQWCFSAQTKNLYQDTIPPESDCINGLNINRENLHNLRLIYQPY